MVRRSKASCEHVKANQAKVGDADGVSGYVVLGGGALCLRALRAGFVSEDVSGSIEQVKSMGMFDFASCKALEMAESGSWRRSPRVVCLG